MYCITKKVFITRQNVQHKLEKSSTLLSCIITYHLKDLRAWVALTFHYPFLHLDSICNLSKIYKCHFACFCAVTSKLFYNKLKWLWNNILLEETLDDCYMACSNIKTNSIISEPNVLEINVHDFERMTCYNERKWWWKKSSVFPPLTLKLDLGRSQSWF